MTDSQQEPSALMFALLIGTAPELTRDYVTTAYEAALVAWRRRDDVASDTAESVLRGNVVQDRELVEPTQDGDLSGALSAPVEGREVSRPSHGVSAAALDIAARRFLSLSGLLPDLTTWAGRQGLWNFARSGR